MSATLFAEPAPVTNRSGVTRRPPSPRDRDGLLRILSDIDRDGWDSLPARSLLAYVRATVVLPNVEMAGMWGPSAEQAEATAWEATWEVLASPALRSAISPWGVLWITARRAVLGELMAGTYCTDVRKAWRLARPNPGGESGGDRSELAARSFAFESPFSLEEFLELGGDIAEDPVEVNATLTQTILGWIVQALIDVGWSDNCAALIVKAITLSADSRDHGPRAANGWRLIAADLGFPPWQVRRATVLLLGAPGWPGLVERLTTRGQAALRDDTSCPRSSRRSTSNSRVPDVPHVGQCMSTYVVPKLSRSAGWSARVRPAADRTPSRSDVAPLRSAQRGSDFVRLSTSRTRWGFGMWTNGVKRAARRAVPDVRGGDAGLEGGDGV